MPIDGRFEVLRQIDTDELGDLIDGYCGPSSAELEQADRAIDTLAGEVARLREENQRMRKALATVELVLIGIRDGVSVTALNGVDDLLGGAQS